MVVLLAACVLSGHGAFVAPDDGCTPGATNHAAVTVEQACSPRPRASIPASLRRGILTSYGVRPSSFRGELDHRVPHFLDGEDTRDNLWPEEGTIPNRKDRLETYAYDRVCRQRSMRPMTAVRLFLGDWRVWYKRVF